LVEFDQGEEEAEAEQKKVGRWGIVVVTEEELIALEDGPLVVQVCG
jgi:hypothetical protein